MSQNFHRIVIFVRFYNQLVEVSSRSRKLICGMSLWFKILYLLLSFLISFDFLQASYRHEYNIRILEVYGNISGCVMHGSPYLVLTYHVSFPHTVCTDTSYDCIGVGTGGGGRTFFSKLNIIK
jgi:hypothetical protein